MLMNLPDANILEAYNKGLIEGQQWKRVENKELQEENEGLKQKIKEIGEKYSKATEYYDEFIVGDFVELPPTAKKFVNQIGDEILQIL